MKKMMSNRNKKIDWSHSRNFRSLNDVQLAKQHYQYEIELHENILKYEFTALRHNFADSVKTSLRKIGTQMMVVSLIKLIKAGITRKRKQ